MEGALKGVEPHQTTFRKTRQAAADMGSDICVRRLRKELKDLKKSPMDQPKITVAPNESNILEMHYVIEGSPDTPYDGGIYHGKLIFPREYPLKPPSVMMLTPSGRFEPNRRLCLSMSDFHPETWNPVWSVGRCKHMILRYFPVLLVSHSSLYALLV